MVNHSNFPLLSSQLSQIHPKSMRDGGLTKKLFRGALFQVIILQQLFISSQMVFPMLTWI